MTRRRSAAPQPRMTPDGFLPGAEIVREAGQDQFVRFASASYDATTHTIDAVLSTGAPVERWGITEVLAVSPEAVELDRVSLGVMSLLDSHRQSSIDDILGKVESVRFEGAALVGRIRFADTKRGQAAEAMVRAGTVKGISIGYRVKTWSLTQSAPDQGTEIWTATRWELTEVSLVSVPADPLALVRAASPAAPPPPAEENDMQRNAPGAADPTPTPPPQPTPTPTPTVAPVQRAADPAPVAPPALPPASPDAAAIHAAAGQRAASIVDIGTRAGMSQADITAALVDATVTLDAFRARAFDALAAGQSATRTSAMQTRIVRDEGDVLRRQIAEAMYRGFGGRDAAAPDDGVRQYLDHSVPELAAEYFGERRMPRNVAERERMLERAFQGTSDFPILLSNSMNRVVDGAYRMAPSTYRAIARQRDFVDFRAHDVLRPGDFPTLTAVGEGGEIKTGVVGDAKMEQIYVRPYARQIRISRQALVNDRMDGIASAIAGYGARVAAFENTTFWTMFESNPTLIEGSNAQFHTSRGNITSSATGAIDVTKLTTGRVAIGKQKTLAGEIMGLEPSLMVVPLIRAQEAYQILASVIPRNASDVGFELPLKTLVVAQLADLPWYLFADPAMQPCFQWGFLNGYSGPRVKIEEPFGYQGMAMSVEHDFGCGAIDWRGAWKNTGA